MTSTHIFFSMLLLGLFANSSGFFLTPSLLPNHKPYCHRPTAMRMQDSEDINSLAGMTQEELDALPDLVMRGKCK
jgi:hypothetical protein